MSKWTRKGRAALEAKTDRYDQVFAYLDGHRIAYGNRHEMTATLRMFCGAVEEVAVADLLTPKMLARSAEVLTCDSCREELWRLDRLRREDPAAHVRELDRLFVEGRGEGS